MTLDDPLGCRRILLESSALPKPRIRLIKVLATACFRNARQNDTIKLSTYISTLGKQVINPLECIVDSRCDLCPVVLELHLVLEGLVLCGAMVKKWK